jgi:ATP-dependent helicase/nuclease subunit B
MSSRPRVFTIPASAPFLPTLAKALVEDRLVRWRSASPDPLALAATTVYLPTRRACRLAADAFLDAMEPEAAVLPRFVALADIDEYEIDFAEAGSAALDLPDALGGLERRLLLTALVLKWAERLAPSEKGEPPLIVRAPATALALADDLARLMDDMTTREVSWTRLDGLVPDQLDEYWQLTLKFLKIAREAWPQILAERGAIEPAARRDRLIAAEAKRLAARPHEPVIVAGSTGSMPATASFIATIARLPHGAVVLPGLDAALDDAAWELIGGRAEAGGRHSLEPAITHPQFALHQLTARIGASRRDVMALGEPRRAREALISEAMRPAAATDRCFPPPP